MNCTQICTHVDFEGLNNEYEGLQIKYDEAMQALHNVQNYLCKEGKAGKAKNEKSEDRCKRNRNW